MTAAVGGKNAGSTSIELGFYFCQWPKKKMRKK